MPRAAVIAALVPLLLAAHACGEDDQRATRDTVDVTDPADEAQASTVALAAAETDLGSILVDGDGRTLYQFLNDDAGTSTCTGDCAERWPPFEATGEVETDGVEADLVGTMVRADGTEQVTYASMPLYHFAGDAGPGDTSGQGVGGVWYVVGPDGEPITGTTAGVGY